MRTEAATVLRARYYGVLASIPPPGTGCHTALLRVANHGVLAHIDPDTMFSDIRHAIPPGTRHIPDKEIIEAITKALMDHQGGTSTPRPRPESVVTDGAAALRRIIRWAKISTEVDLWEALGGLIRAHDLAVLEITRLARAIQRCGELLRRSNIVGAVDDL